MTDWTSNNSLASILTLINTIIKNILRIKHAERKNLIENIQIIKKKLN